MSDFDFTEGDTVTVRVRERGTSGNIVCKFTTECKKIKTKTRFSSPKARFELPGTLNSVTYAPHEAEYEVVE